MKKLVKNKVVSQTNNSDNENTNYVNLTANLEETMYGLNSYIDNADDLVDRFFREG